MNTEHEREKGWMGKKGFDEAYYYREGNSGIGPLHSDITVKERVKEALDRQGCESSAFHIEVASGIVTLKGPFILLGKAAAIIRGLSGVKAVRTQEQRD